VCACVLDKSKLSKVPWDPFATGLELILDEFTTWILNFNCFRISFLVLLLQNLPMTLCNFWFISSCRIASAQLPFWPLFLSGVSTLFSLLWRLVMMYYAYRHFWFFKQHKSTTTTTTLNRHNSTLTELKSKVGLSVEERMSEYDECWPVRYAYERTVVPYQETNTTTIVPGSNCVTVANANSVVNHVHASKKQRKSLHTIVRTNVKSARVQLKRCCFVIIIINNISLQTITLLLLRIPCQHNIHRYVLIMLSSVFIPLHMSTAFNNT
jgi:hypothetical protein